MTYLKVIGIVALVLIPLLGSEYLGSLVSEALIFAIFALGINVLLGHMGYVSFGHAMFMGIGGYIYASGTLLMELPPFVSALAGVAGTLLFGLLVGLVCMRVNRIQFVLITLVFGEMWHGIFVVIRATGGTDGIAGLPRPDMAWLDIDLWNTTPFYYYVLVVFLIVISALYRLKRSPFGLAMTGIRENEDRMIAAGYRIATYKYLAFGLSGLVSGVAGILLAQKTSFVSPSIMSWTVSGEGLLIVIMGGAGYLLGPVIGALFFVGFKDLLSIVTDEYLTVFGFTFILIVAFLKGGIFGYIVEKLGLREQ